MNCLLGMFDDEFCTYKSKCYENHGQGQSKGKEFLAATSSSRSDGVTHFVRSSIHDQGVLFSI